jgi:hypothetical protein
VAFLSANETVAKALSKLNFEENITHAIGEQGYFLLGTLIFFAMAFLLYRIAVKPEDPSITH